MWETQEDTRVPRHSKGQRRGGDSCGEKKEESGVSQVGKTGGHTCTNREERRGRCLSGGENRRTHLYKHSLNGSETGRRLLWREERRGRCLSGGEHRKNRWTHLNKHTQTVKEGDETCGGREEQEKTRVQTDSKGQRRGRDSCGTVSPRYLT